MKCQEIQQNETGERYLRGRLPEAERDAYEEHYLGCERCFAELETLRLLEAELTRQAPQIRAEAIARPPGVKWFWFAIPALAALAAVGLFVMRPANPVPAAAPPATVAQVSKPAPSPLLALAQYEAPAYQEAYLRGTDVTPLFRQAMSAYQVQDYANAMKTLRTAGSDTRTLFFLAACELLNGEAAAARATAGRVLAGGETPYLEETYFLRAKANLALGDAAAATSDLEKLIALEGDWAARGRALLAQLKAIR